MNLKVIMMGKLLAKINMTASLPHRGMHCLPDQQNYTRERVGSKSWMDGSLLIIFSHMRLYFTEGVVRLTHITASVPADPRSVSTLSPAPGLTLFISNHHVLHVGIIS